MENTLVIPQAFTPAVMRLTMQQRGQLLTAMMQYAFDGDIPTIEDATVDLLFTSIKPDIDERKAKRERTSRNCSYARLRDWQKRKAKPAAAPKAPPAALDLSFVDDRLRPAVDRWLHYKRERREGYRSTSSVKAFVTTLRNLSGDDPAMAMRIVEQSIGNNYKGIFSVKQHDNNIKHTQDRRRGVEPPAVELSRYSQPI